MLGAAFASCDGLIPSQDTESISDTVSEQASDTVESETSSEDTDSDILPEVLDVELVKEGRAMYYVVCEDESKYGAAAQYIIDDIRRKTGVLMDTHWEKRANSSLKMIYVGGDYKSLFPDSEVRLTYKGYAVQLLDGDIYLCGGSDETVRTAASKWLSSIPTKEYLTKNEEGKATFVIPASSMFVYNPSYQVSDPVLLSAHISDYSIVYSSDSIVGKLLAELLSDDIALLCGFKLDVISDKNAAGEREILCGNTNRRTQESLDSYSYAITDDGTRLCLDFGSTAAFDGIRYSLREAFGKTSLNIGGRTGEKLSISKNSGEIRIMTSNVLFSTDTSTGLSWRDRAALLSDLYLDFKPDFIGLQEAAGNIGDAIKKNVSSEYTMVSQSSNRHTPILYRTDAWRIATDELGAEIKGTQMFANNWCWGYEWVMFESITDPDVRVIVMNLHFHPDMEEYRASRETDIDLFNAEVRRLESEYQDVALFVTGDYNTGSSHTRVDLEDGWDEDITVGTKIECGAQLTTDTDDGQGIAIDHICVSYELADVIRHRGVSYETMKKSSDHIPYFVDVTLK